MSLRWKKDERETGLRAITAGPRSSKLHNGTDSFATVNAHSTRHTGITGWYWAASSHGSVPFRNTAGEKPLTEAGAKAEAAAYVKKHLKGTAP